MTEETEEGYWRGEDKRHVWVAATLPLPPLTSSRNSKQTLKSTISLLVFPSDGEQWLNTQFPIPRSCHHRGRKTTTKKSISKRHIGTCVCVFMCVCRCVCMCMCGITLQGHTRNTVSGSSEVSPGVKSVTRRAEKRGEVTPRDPSL